MEIETTLDSLILRNGRCPIYDGFKMAGLDDETIDKLCIIREGAQKEMIVEFEE